MVFLFERIPLLKINTLFETNIAAIARANRPKSSKGNFIFQPSIFRWELLVSRRVLLMENASNDMVNISLCKRFYTCQVAQGIFHQQYLLE